MSELEKIGQRAKQASAKVGLLGQNKKNEALTYVAEALWTEKDDILAANQIDVENAKQNRMMASLIDRLMLTESRIKGMQEAILEVVKLEDPIGEMMNIKTRPNGLIIGEKRVPLGVIGIIYESRPNVTADAFSLCFKTGNACILRGGSDSIHSNVAIIKAIKTGLKKADVCEDAVILIEDTSHERVNELMKMNQYVDVLIPRGGRGLIQNVINNSTVPVIETGTGNCHIYVDETAEFDMALNIIENAKTQRLGVCNACESLVVHEKVAADFLPLLFDRLTAKEVEIRGDERALAICPKMTKASEEDYYTEYLDKIISLKIVDSIEEAIAHINKYNTKHSEAIITKDYERSMKFVNEIDAACVYVNASTRFTDGNEFGFGAEIGISTQKLHARGPMGLTALTTKKFIILGTGQVRP